MKIIRDWTFILTNGKDQKSYVVNNETLENATAEVSRWIKENNGYKVISKSSERPTDPETGEYFQR